ncbi:MAG TPA: hypothetical protein VGB07_14140 [Blastocatellia bacterium]
MNDREIDLNSVNWTEGMLLRPEHFIRQEQYFDSGLLWLARFTTDAYGLVGIGARGDAAERGAARHDPVVSVDDDGERLKISLTQCRGISPSGDIIEIDPSNPLDESFSKREFEGTPELGVYVVCTPHLKTVTTGAEDSANPMIQSTRRQKYRLKLDVTAAEAPHALMVSRVRKIEGTLQYEKMSGFIPMCTTLIGHSELKRAWDRLREQIISLANRYTQLHKAMVEYIAMAGGRSINTREDEESLQFVGRMVMTLESGIHDVLNPLQPPTSFLQKLYRVVRSAAVYLDLSPPTHDYFRQLAKVGVTEFETLLEQERQTLLNSRSLTIRDNLALDVQRVEQAFYRLRRLEEALEGKYLDYRLSAALEALSFFFDRRTETPALYQSLARPARPQLFANEMTFVFAGLHLDGRQTYRIVLIRESEARVEMGEMIAAEVRINVGAGQGFESLYPKAKCEVPEQRNFAIDFEAPPEAHTIHDLRVIVNTAHPIRSCLLYQRRRFIEGGASHVSIQPPPAFPPPPQPPPNFPKPPALKTTTPVPEAPEQNPAVRRNRIEVEPEPRREQPDNEPPVRRRRIEW